MSKKVPLPFETKLNLGLISVDIGFLVLIVTGIELFLLFTKNPFAVVIISNNPILIFILFLGCLSAFFGTKTHKKSSITGMILNGVTALLIIYISKFLI